MNLRRFVALFCTLIIMPASTYAAQSAAAKIDALGDRYYKYELETDYAVALQQGVPVTALRPISEKNAAADAAFAHGVLHELDAIDPNTLDHNHWLSYRALRYNMDGYVGAQKYYWLGQHLAPYSQPFAYTLQVFGSYPLKTAQDVDGFVKLLGDYAALADSVHTFVQGQHDRHIILPSAEIDAVVAQLSAFAASEHNPIFVDDARFASLPADIRESAKTRINATINDKVIPAFTSLRSFVDGPYRQGAPQAVGQWQYPGGRDYYRWLVKRSTTLDMTPQQIHQLGLHEVARLRAELDGVRKSVGFTGDLNAFMAYLRTDKRFFATTSDEIGEKLTAFVNRVAPKVPQFYLAFPKEPYGVAALPASLAGGQTFGYYQPPTAAHSRGTYLYNGASPATTSIIGAGALITHELIPGHHFQFSLQQDNTTLPHFRRNDFTITAFVEGYAEYASQLGFMMGVYGDPYDHAGRLLQDLMVSTRLVVDTGMNELGWSRDRAMTFMHDNTNLNEKQIGTESLRYSCDLPAQALAYKIGELTMLRYRSEAQKRLGATFDIRQFHSWLLGSGAMTLDTLDRHLQYEERLAARH